jgi:hypothetical protein
MRKMVTGGMISLTAIAVLTSASGLMGMLRAQQNPQDMPLASPAAKAKGDAARKAIHEHQKALRADQVYDCCIRPGCVFCSTAADMCPCAMNLSQGQPVCPECWGGWFAGKGRLQGVNLGPDAQNIHVLPQAKMKMMYDMKEMGMRKAAGGAQPPGTGSQPSPRRSEGSGG